MREPISSTQARKRDWSNKTEPTPCLHCGKRSQTGLHFKCRRRYGVKLNPWAPMSLGGGRPSGVGIGPGDQI